MQKALGGTSEWHLARRRNHGWSSLGMLKGVSERESDEVVSEGMAKVLGWTS